MSIHNEFHQFLDFTRQNLGLNEQEVTRLGIDLSKEFGGSYVYVSKRFEATQRDKEIIASYNGRNIKELSEQYGLSARQIYNIING